MIEFKKVNFKYPGCSRKDDRVLYNMDLRFQKQKFYTVVGPNGSGKSTLAKLVNGLIEPESGEIYVDGTPVISDNFIDIRQKVGYIFQNPENQIVSMLVETEAAFALENLGVPHDVMQQKVKNILNFVELGNYAKKPPHMLSGGQKQRLAIASVIIMEPDYLILDEPASMLDYNGRLEVKDLILKLNKHKKTIILISHDPADIILSDEVVVLNDGKLEAQVTPQHFFNNQNLIKKAGFFEVPDFINYGLEFNMKKFTKNDVLEKIRSNKKISI
ncbi:MAG: ATP-binding cassette domain-containing protein [Candidatus Muiribacteriota bacterium]